MTLIQRHKLINLLLILTSLLGYLEWGRDNHSFLFQMEGELLAKLITEPKTVMHPFTLLPLAGQILLLITLFQKRPRRLLTWLGMVGIGLLLFMILLVGTLSFNWLILGSALPFWLVVVWAIVFMRRQKRAEKEGNS
ncbi:MAG: hypothetical protein H6581_28240 [Bacteroidia bacterium]|nr:hypothetical protein [Bacteroidia bacterium]